jgi:hydrogenase maturation factor HypE
MAVAEHLAVPLLGGTTLAVGHDVVDLALFRREVAELVLALEVAYFDGSAGG